MVSAGGNSKRAPILIVDDDALVASIISEVLDELGYAVAGIASSAPEALSLAGEQRARLALVDIRLAGPMDGIDLACALREHFGIPAIFLSGVADPAVRIRAKGARPLGFLSKPFRPSQVFDAIERALRES